MDNKAVMIPSHKLRRQAALWIAHTPPPTVERMAQADGEAEALADNGLGDVEVVASGLAEALSDTALADAEADAEALCEGLSVAGLGVTEGVASGLGEALPACPTPGAIGKGMDQVECRTLVSDKSPSRIHVPGKSVVIGQKKVQNAAPNQHAIETKNRKKSEHKKRTTR